MHQKGITLKKENSMQKLKDFAQSMYGKWTMMSKKTKIAVAIGVLIIIIAIIGG